MVWTQSVLELPSAYKGVSIRYPQLTRDDGTSILFRHSIPGVFNVLRYICSKFSIDLTIQKKSITSRKEKSAKITLFIYSDIMNYMKERQKNPWRPDLSSDDTAKALTDTLSALSNWPGFFHPDDGVLKEIVRSKTQLRWYDAERMAEDPFGKYYWIGNTELGVQVEKRIIERVAAGEAWRISEEEKLWEVASEQYAAGVSGDVIVL